MALFKGTTQACMMHLRDAIEDGYLAKRHVVASFVGVDDQTVRRWLAGDYLPAGEPLIKFRFYIEFLGYDVEELNALDSNVRDVARIFAFGVVPLEEVVNAVGYPEGRNGLDSVIRIFRGARGISTDKATLFASFARRYSDQLADRQRMTDRIQLKNVASSEEVPEIVRPSALPIRLAAQQPLSTHEALIESLAASIKAMIPLAREISSDRFTSAERARVRELTDRDGPFTLANMLYRMCGERARKMHS